MRYNPFNKQISQLTEEDLHLLINQKVAEGQYIEYKEQFPRTAKISHSIAAFANSDGGWFIVGIKDNQDNAAILIDGFDPLHMQPKERMRDIILAHINPKPIFESKLITLDNNHVVLLTYVERGLETPYVTKDGRIYRRVGEGISPIAEKDRYFLQKLFERNQEIRQVAALFCKNPFKMSKIQAGSTPAFLEGYFLVNPFNHFSFHDFHTRDFFEQLYLLFQDDTLGRSSLSLNHIHSSHNSIILRASPSADLSINLGLSIEIFRDGNLKFFLPIQELPLDNLRFIQSNWSDSEVFPRFYEQLSREQQENLKVIDGDHLIGVFRQIFLKYRRLLGQYRFKRPVRARFKFTDIWRKILYFDSVEYLDFIEKYGIPINHKSEIEIPDILSDAFLKISLNRNHGSDLAIQISEALGIPEYFSRDMV